MFCFSPLAGFRRWYFLFVFMFFVCLAYEMTLHERKALSFLFTPDPLRGTMPGPEEVLHKCLSAEWIAVFHIAALIAIPMMRLGGAQGLVDSGESHHDLDSQLFTTGLCINFECRQLGCVPRADKWHLFVFWWTTLQHGRVRWWLGKAEWAAAPSRGNSEP